mmetsp:Transcript_31153/g.68404  ORF Transcript_31153/g.68404 Transcript_31153/m.68404 type:complete len:245 (+) Transcript_31153:178-912(+)
MTATATTEIPPDVEQIVGSADKASDDSCKPSADPTPSHKAIDASVNSPSFAIRQFDPSSSPPSEMSQIRDLFKVGMNSVNAPSSYIERSLSLDIKDVDSMADTYCKGRGTFILMDKACGDDSSSSREIVGMVGLQDASPQTGACRHDKDIETRNVCELRRMSIHSSYRRCGFGAKLIDSCVRHAKAMGFDGIKLYTGSWMTAAIEFYVKMGFRDMGRIEYKADDDGTDGGRSCAVVIAHLEMMF